MPHSKMASFIQSPFFWAVVVVCGVALATANHRPLTSKSAPTTSSPAPFIVWGRQVRGYTTTLQLIPVGGELHEKITAYPDDTFSDTFVGVGAWQGRFDQILRYHPVAACRITLQSPDEVYVHFGRAYVWGGVGGLTKLPDKAMRQSARYARTTLAAAVGGPLR